MARDINWKAVDAEGNKYCVRVEWWSAQFKFQFKYAGTSEWVYDREPTLLDLQMLQETILRRYNRRQATYKEVQEVERLLSEYERRGF
jgi:hypothetical protein